MVPITKSFAIIGDKPIFDSNFMKIKEKHKLNKATKKI